MAEDHAFGTGTGGEGGVEGAAPPQIPVLLAVVLLVYVGQTTLSPVLAPLSRAVGLQEWQIGVTMSLAALMVALVSPWWGLRSQERGARPVLVVALAAGTATLALFAVLVRSAMAGLVGGILLFVLFLLIRGLAFGSALSAVGPAAQSCVAAATPDGPERVRGLAAIGAVQGVAMIVGATAGGVLARWGLLVPVVLAPVLVALALAVVGLLLRREAKGHAGEVAVKVDPRDPRVLPYLVVGFVLFTGLGFVQILMGFLVQDRFGYDDRTTGLVTGLLLLAAGVGQVLAQGLVVPRSRWSPVQLLRRGSVISMVGFALLVPEAGTVIVALAVFVIGFGLGIALPGYTAGPTLLVSKQEQGGLAGLVGSTNGLTYVITPTVSTLLYGLWPLLPIIISVVLIGVVVVLVFLHPRFVADAKARLGGVGIGQDDNA
ncbi:MFS transporter [Schaalia sp. 19OD2882]|uniref:MFS transporter n=1 Tax=Schaalia sp. 19OD2882 TaxID=2794089 RepID=UPI001C1EE717|nr:MFS transporter [Schaalia sp. 19OD2882]QWW19076.1 MFS transporter [Schaalia sp. 19OD2882]